MIVYGVIGRAGSSKPGRLVLMPSFFDLTTDLNEARRVAANINGIVVRLGNILNTEPPTERTPHAQPD